jgi:hypothetical protein
MKPDSSTVVCEYCGSEFLFDPQTNQVKLEGYAACPRCRRNDRVEKISSIQASQIQQISGSTIQQQSYMKGRRELTRDVAVPYNATQSTVLAQKFIEPVWQTMPAAPAEPSLPNEPRKQWTPREPKEPSLFTIDIYKQSGRKKVWIGIILAFVIFILSMFMSSISSTGDKSSDTAFLLLACLPFALLIGSPLVIIGFRQQKIANNPKAIEKLTQRSQQRHKTYLSAVNDWKKKISGSEEIHQETIEKWRQEVSEIQSEHESKLDEWNKQVSAIERAKANWENLYYCYRDDCAFVPGTGKWTAVNEVQNYVHSV